jgi:hypothetical protein
MKTGKEELIEVENRIEKVLGKLPSMPSIQTLEDQLAVSVFTLLLPLFRIRIGSGYSLVCGSRSGLGIRIQLCKNNPAKKLKKTAVLV